MRFWVWLQFCLDDLTLHRWRWLCDRVDRYITEEESTC